MSARKSKSAKRRHSKYVLKLPDRKVPDWVIERGWRKVVAFIRRRRRKAGAKVDDLAPWGRLSRRGWNKLEKGTKVGPLLATILRAFYALNLRDWALVITREGAQLLRLKPAHERNSCSVEGWFVGG